MNFSHQISYVILLVFASTATAYSQIEGHDLSPQQRWLRGQSVFAVAIAPQPLTTQYFSAKSLKESLPRLWPAHIIADWCKGKEKQRGVIVLENGDVIFWHSCAANLIVFEGDKYPGAFGFEKSDPTFKE